jgi:N-acetylneuraminate synthase
MKILGRFNFRDLFVLDVANNHQGNVLHGTRIIRECASLAKSHGLRAAVKFQFRDLPTFIHMDERIDPKNKHVPRFLSTKLHWNDFEILVDIVREEGLISMCTPFDETSVEKIIELGFDIIKVASCSATDWPLLEKIADSGLPISRQQAALNSKR